MSKELEYVTIYLDHPNVGCGFRRAFVTSKGPTWVKLFYPAGMKTVTLTRYAFDTSKAVPVLQYDRNAVADLIQAQVINAKNDASFDGGRVARDLIDTLSS